MVAILKTLIDNPSSVFSLGHFAARLGAAKSTISEDIAVIKDALSSLGGGTLETTLGVSGGVRYLPGCDKQRASRLVADLCGALSQPERLLPGGFLYMADIMFSPAWASLIGELFCSRFRNSGAQYVLTVETKGIPAALCTARSLGIPLVVSRRDARPTEGPSVSINYVSGSSGQIQTMSLPKKALSPGSRVLIIDDFMKGGGTAKGMTELVAEFGARTVGIAVLIEMAEPEKKLVSDYMSLVVLHSVDVTSKTIDIRPSERIWR